MSPFDLSNYEPVEDRLRAFWSEHTDGRVSTKIEHIGPDGYIVLAAIWRDANDPHPASTGLAAESITERGVNSTSALENCETSAIGRALANLGYAPKGARPSREEMSKASRATSDSGATSPPRAAGAGDSKPASPPESGTTSVPTSLTQAGAAESGSGAVGGEAAASDPGLGPHEPQWVDSPTVRNMQMCAVAKCSLHPSRRKPAEVPA